MAKKNSDSSSGLTKEQLAKIAETAAKIAIEQYHKESDRAAEEKRDKRLYNTRLLMEKYRGMNKYSEDAVSDAIQLENEHDFMSLMEMMKDGNDNYTLTVRSIQERAATVRIILCHMNKMLDYYHHHCVSSGKQEIIRKWDTINYLYLIEDEKTVQELADMYYVDERTVYRYNRAALQDLSALFFGYVD